MNHTAKLLRAGLVAAFSAASLVAADVAVAGWQGQGQGRGQGKVWGSDRGRVQPGQRGHSNSGKHGGSNVFIAGSFWWPGYSYYGYPYAYPYPYGYAYPYRPYPYAYPYSYPAYAYGYAYPYSYPYPVRTYPPPVGEAPAPKWYYCPDSQMYYPHVNECASGWNAVPAQPVNSSQR